MIPNVAGILNPFFNQYEVQNPGYLAKKVCLHF